MAAQIRNVVDELENVVGPVVFGKTRATTDAAGEIRQRDIRKAADGLGCAIAEGNSIVRLSVILAGTIRCFERLIEAVVTKPERVNRGRTLRVVPLHTRKMHPCLVGRTPIGLSDRLVIYDESPVRTEVVLTIQRVLRADMQIHLSECAVHFVVGVHTAGNVRAGGAIRVQSALENGRKLENGIATGAIAIRIESGNFEAGLAQRSARGLDGVTCPDDTRGSAGNRERVGIQTRI